MIGPSVRWDFVYGVALAAILSMVAAVAWFQGEGAIRQTTNPGASATASPLKECD